jgi:nucleoid DNA-binding protein
LAQTLVAFKINIRRARASRVARADQSERVSARRQLEFSPAIAHSSPFFQIER